MTGRRMLVVALLLLAAIGGLTAWVQLKPQQAYAASMAFERWRAGLETHTVDVHGLTWTYSRGGSGEPLLLLHGFGADRDNYVRVARFLEDHFDVIAPDLPGFGESDTPQSDYGIDTQADRVLAFAKALGLVQFHVGGSSMGGYIAMAMAAKSPQVESLWLLAPGGLASGRPSEMFGMITEKGDNPLISDTPEDFQRTLDFVFAQRPFIPGPVVGYLGQRAANRAALNRQIFTDMTASYEQSPAESYLRQIKVPIQVVWGSRDRVLHPDGAEIISRVHPTADVVLLEGIGHLPMIEAPEDSARRYLAWRAGL